MLILLHARYNAKLKRNYRYVLSATLSSATQHAMSPEFGRKWGKECLNTRFPLPTLQCEGYSVKLIWFDFFVCLNYITTVYFAIWIVSSSLVTNAIKWHSKGQLNGLNDSKLTESRERNYFLLDNTNRKKSYLFNINKSASCCIPHTAR